MKTALLHYWLTNWRGGEKVLAALAEMFPTADIYTHAYRPERVPQFSKRRVKESFIAHLPTARHHPQRFLPLMPRATAAFDLSDYDLIISSESGPIKGIRKPAAARHICYCHTPMRYLWDLHDDYYRSAGWGGKLAMRLFTRYLRAADLKSADSVDQFIANSQCVAERIRRLYGRDATVVYPPVAVDFYAARPLDRAPLDKPYYLFVGAPVPYKRLDLARAACARLGRDLRVVSGGVTSDEELRDLYAQATALLFPGLEDFGIVPVEAMAAGCPVIAYGAGGALETVVEGETGLFFREPTIDSLIAAMEEFESRPWNREACRVRARLFSRDRFNAALRRIVKI